ncbi:hypothetical protein [Arenibacter latericius]|uniref:hypothetical protein n=1 Tax=Arenibacter latericius TaxID=86104 RepID=UPI00041BFA65|nr:hypothetical protein [Arenibacter latericius]MDX1363411.1 hypothetical protein [Arenibacter latericius]
MMSILNLKYMLFSTVFFFLAKSCSEGEVGVSDKTELDTMHKEIQKLAKSEDCDDSKQWRFTALGAKPCGGPTSYIAYSAKIDTVLFLSMVKEYNKGMVEYNIENGLVSDCAMVAMPSGVICKENMPVFIYSNSKAE